MGQFVSKIDEKVEILASRDRLGISRYQGSHVDMTRRFYLLLLLIPLLSIVSGSFYLLAYLKGGPDEELDYIVRENIHDAIQ